MVGYAPDLRHPLAPPEVVYEVEARPRPNWLQKSIVLVSLIVGLFMVGMGVAQWVSAPQENTWKVALIIAAIAGHAMVFWRR